jgi:S-adenosylmethionine:tRNA ribosyltransferase-isomerase
MAREPLSLYDYELPQERIAQTPLADRAASRLLVLDRASGEIRHLTFQNILDFTLPGDVWVFNNTRVFPARVFLKKDSGADVELLFLEQVSHESARHPVWSALARPGKRLKPGTELFHPETGNTVCRTLCKKDNGVIHFELLLREPLFDFLNRCGVVPLPPYIKEKVDDPNRYQTIYAQETGSSAAPTAGLHFTPELMERLKQKVETAEVTLHIGMDTFQPISVEDVADHRMHTEFIHVPQFAAEAVCRARAHGRRVVCVGTTSVRTLESWATHCGELKTEPYSARTDLFIHSGYKYKVVDALLTNFHLPRSTLLVMVSALAGRGKVMRAYAEAVEQHYRFFSFGDAMLIL